MNYRITNKTVSVVDMAPLRDVLGAVITLKPKGQNGDEREVDNATVNNPIVERMHHSRYIDVQPLAPQGLLVPQEPPKSEPAALPKEEVPAASLEHPKDEEPPAPLLEQPVVTDVAPSEAPVVEAPAETPATEPAKTEGATLAPASAPAPAPRATNKNKSRP